ncbi:MAG: hypothetical protein K9J13_09545, partial [Saprospiraceae bacterium]|nr:hypothetical protein [Saprospiraceae bacterium]
QGSYYNYSWSPISGLNSSSTANPIATPTATTTYTVTVSGGGCNTSYTDQIIIYVNSDTTNYILDKSMDYKVCDGDFYDSGGTDPEFGYQNNEDYIVTFYPCESYKRVSIDFSEYFDIEENNDWLKIYNGPTEASTLIGTYDGVSSPGTFTSTHSTGALTFVFHSDESGTGNGWDAEISCTTPDCETIAGDATITDDGNGLSSGMASFQLSGNTGTFSTWQKSEISTDNYINISGSTINDSVFVNTTTNFRAVVIAGTTTCYSSVVTYLSSNNYFVNDDSRIGDNWCTAVGDENNDGCSNAKPDNLVSGIIENISLKAGDTIFIDAGDFTDAIHISPTDSGSSESNVVLLGAGSDNTVINASSEEEVIELNQTAYIEVRDISLSSEETNNVCLKISDSHYNLISNCAVNSTQTTNCLILGESASYNTDNNKIKNSTITNEQSDAKNIEVRGKCNSTVIQNNIITNLAEGIGSTGIYFNYYSEGEDNYAPSTGIIHNNYIKLNGTGIYLNGGDGESLKICNSTITQNMININSQDANETFAIKINYSGIDEYDTTEISKNWLKGAEKSIYLDNTIYADINCNYITNSNTGIHVNDDNSIYIDLYCNSFYNDDNNVVFPTETAANTWNFQNNILSVTSSEGSCIKLYQTNSSLQFLSCDYNLFDTINGNDIALLEATSYSSLNDWTSYDHDAGAGNGDANSLTGNPDFTSAENGNLSIYESSPASGAGIKIDGLDVDINNLTIDENDVAIGASNFQAYPGIDSPYGILKKKLDGSSYLVKRGYLKFKFTEEYFQDTGAALQFNIYDWERKLVYTTSTTTFDTDLKLGDNRYDWNFSICNSKLKYNHFYVLEVINNKDEKWYLKFKNTTPFYLRVCLFDIAPQTYIGGFFTSWP